MQKKEKVYKESVFNKAIKIRDSQHKWIRQNKDTKTLAGYLDKIINQYKNGST